MNAAILPILLPMLTAIAALFAGRPGSARRAFIALSALAQTAIAGWILARTLGGEILALGVGRWSAAAGIVVAIDTLGALMVLLASGTVLTAILYSYAETRTSVEHPLRLPLLQFLLMGLNLSFCTGDLFNLFVGFEIMLISSYALLTLEADDWEIKQAYPYLALNLVGSTLFLVAAGLIYALAGTLNYALLHERLAGMIADPRLSVIATLLLLVFSMKAGLYPFYYWLPNSYPILATPLLAVYAGLLTKVGVYVLLRITGTVLPHELAGSYDVLGLLAMVTIAVGAIGSLARGFVRGMLAFQVLVGVGTMVLAISWFHPVAIAACLFYLMQDIPSKAGLFLAAGAASIRTGSDRLDRMGGLWAGAPILGLAFLCLALSLCGLPPFSGFWAKLSVLQAGVALGHPAGVATILVASVLTLAAVLRIWHFAFWRTTPGHPLSAPPRRWRMLLAMPVALAALIAALGLAAEPAVRIARAAADAVLRPAPYISSVLTLVGKSETGPKTH